MPSIITKLFSVAISGALALSPALGRPARGMILHPELTPEQQARLVAASARVTCDAGSTDAVSAYGSHMGSAGSDSVVEYATTVSSKGTGWQTNDTYIAPCTGEYSFSISFNTDSYYPCPTAVADQNDVLVYLVKSTAPLYNDAAVIGNGWGAWRGQLADDVKRGQAAYTLNLWLKTGDAITTKVASDGGGLRCLESANFSAVRTSD